MNIIITIALISLYTFIASIVTACLCREDKLKSYYRQIQAVKDGNEYVKRTRVIRRSKS